MPLHRTQNAPPALQTVRVPHLTSFPAHSLADGDGVAHVGLPAEPSKLANGGISTSSLREIRTPELPIAAPIPLENRLAVE